MTSGRVSVGLKRVPVHCNLLTPRVWQWYGVDVLFPESGFIMPGKKGGIVGRALDCQGSWVAPSKSATHISFPILGKILTC